MSLVWALLQVGLLECSWPNTHLLVGRYHSRPRASRSTVGCLCPPASAAADAVVAVARVIVHGRGGSRGDVGSARSLVEVARTRLPL